MLERMSPNLNTSCFRQRGWREEHKAKMRKYTNLILYARLQRPTNSPTSVPNPRPEHNMQEQHR